MLNAAFTVCAANRMVALWTVLWLVAATSACTAPNAALRTGYPIGYEERGIASWYGPGFQGKKTANGERFDMRLLTAAHRTLPMGTLVRVRSLTTGREVTVRINDRGPFAGNRIIDLSQAAANVLRMTGNGTDEVILRVVGHQGRSGDQGWLRVQVASFLDRERAEALAKRLRERYDEVTISTVDLPDGRRYRVQVGRFTSEAQATATARELDRRFNVEAVIVRDDV
jgi:rare lipoprotein A